MSTRSEIIRRRVLMPLGLALILLLTFSVASIYWQHSKYASDAVEEKIGEVGSIPGQGATFWFTVPVAGTHKRADGFGVKAGINIIMEG